MTERELPGDSAPSKSPVGRCGRRQGWNPGKPAGGPDIPRAEARSFRRIGVEAGTPGVSRAR